MFGDPGTITIVNERDSAFRRKSVISDQLLAVAIIALMMAAFVWGRLRYDLVAAAALVISLIVGVVPLDAAFRGFSDDIVIIVGSALLVSTAVARSGIMELAIKRYAPDVGSVRGQLALLVLVVAVLSAFVKNIGALAILMPVAFQFAARTKTSPSVFLMPMAFASLLGGLTTLIGTSPNIVVSSIREEITGTPFTMFDFAPVGVLLAAIGALFLVLFYWLVPIRRRESRAMHEALNITNYLSEAEVADTSAIVGKTVVDLLQLAKGSVAVTTILRSGVRITPLPDTTLREGDILLIEGEHDALDRLVTQAGLSVTGDRTHGAEAADAVEAVIGGGSSLVGWSAKTLNLFDRTGINVLAISRRGRRLTQRLGTITFEVGDIIIVQGDRRALPELLRDLGCLPLAERPVRLGSVRRGVMPILILGAAMLATATGTVPVPIAFFTAAVAMVLFGLIPLREVYTALDGPILVMLAALIPVSDSLRRSGATENIAHFLADMSAAMPPYAALALMLTAAMAVTPFLNNAATVLVMAPIAASFAATLGLRPEAFLMAVAIGAGCDFLTPIGHQCNTLVMGPGGYRFSDYPRLGLPLSLIVVVLAVPALMLAWPI